LLIRVQSSSVLILKLMPQVRGLRAELGPDPVKEEMLHRQLPLARAR